jgi:hypothetical protein
MIGLIDQILTENSLSFLSESKASDYRFEAWFQGSKIVDDQGNPLLVYHGSDARFSVFDEDKIADANGRSEGAGFYFTNNREVASGYRADSGQLVEAYLSVKSPIAYNQGGFNRAQLKKLIWKVAELENEDTREGIENGFLSNYGWIPDEGRNFVIDAAISSMVGEDAINQIGGIMGAGVPIKIVNRAVYQATGHDGYWSKGFSNLGKSDTMIYVAMFPEQIKIVNVS